MSKILLTGSGGFAGGNLKTFLEPKGFEIIAPGSSSFNYEDPAAVKDLFKQHHFDFVIHAGFYGISDPKNIAPDIIERNLAIFNNLAANLNKDSFMISLGSGAEYDKSKPIVKVKESDFGTSIPNDLYGKAKYLISKEIEKYPNIYNFRLFALYGKGEGPQRFINYAIKQNIKKEPVNMYQNVIFSYLYIEDFCQIIYSFLKQMPAKRFINLAPTEVTDLLTITKLVDKAGNYINTVNIEKEGLNNEYSADNSTLREMLPGFGFTSCENGIKKYYDVLKES